MQILYEIASNSEGMFWYQICSFCIGVYFIICRDEKRMRYKLSVYSVCVVNAFLWGSMALFRLCFTNVSLLIGGISGLVLTVVLFAVKKGSEKQLLGFWCLVKVILVVGNFVIEHDLEQQEEMIFAMATGASLFLFLIMFISSKGIFEFFGIIYGSFLVTGCIYESVYDVIIDHTKFLNTNTDYINFYKALFKVDWTEDGTGIFFAVLCAGMIVFGGVYRRRFQGSGQ